MGGWFGSGYRRIERGVVEVKEGKEWDRKSWGVIGGGVKVCWVRW